MARPLSARTLVAWAPLGLRCLLPALFSACALVGLGSFVHRGLLGPVASRRQMQGGLSRRIGAGGCAQPGAGGCAQRSWEVWGAPAPRSGACARSGPGPLRLCAADGESGAASVQVFWHPALKIGGRAANQQACLRWRVRGLTANQPHGMVRSKILAYLQSISDLITCLPAGL